MAERVRTDLGFQPLYASLSFSDINTSVVYNTQTQQLHYGYISGAAGSYDLDFAALNIYTSGSIFAAGAITASAGFYGNFNIDDPDTSILFANQGGSDTQIDGNLNFTYNKSETNPVITIKSGQSAGERSRLFISGVYKSSIDLISGIPQISFEDTAETGELSSSIFQQSGSVFKIFSDQGVGNTITINPLSGSISASGHLFASLSLESNGDGLVAYDTTNGQFYYTGSYQHIDSDNDEILFNDNGIITSSNNLKFTLSATSPYSQSIFLKGPGNTRLYMSGTYAPNLHMLGKYPRVRFEAEDPDNPGNPDFYKDFFIDVAESNELSNPLYLRFGASLGFNGIHFDLAGGEERIYANNLTLISGGFNPGATSVTVAMPGGLVAEQISASYNVTASKFQGFGDLTDPTQAQFIGTASWALNAVSSSYIPTLQEVTTAGNSTTTNVILSSSLTVLGTASINYLHTIYESSSIIYSSGSTKFGDTSDDTHQRTGSMFISGAQFTIPSGSITASDALIERNADGGDVVLTVFNSNTDGGLDKHAGIEFKHAAVVGVERNAGKIIAGKDDTYGGSVPYLNNANSNLQFYTTFQGVDEKALHISYLKHITASGVFSSSAVGTNLIGTASWATASVSASFAEFASSASYASSSTSASFAEFASSASYASASTSASYALNASNLGIAPNYLFFTKSGVLGVDQSQILNTLNTSSFDGAIYDYTLSSAESGSRTGQFFVTHWSGTIEYTDTSTIHIGPETQRPDLSASLAADRLDVRINYGKGYIFKAYVKQL